LGDMPFILYQRGSRVETIVSAYFDHLNFRPKVVMRSDSAEAIKAMIRSGLGISVLFVWNLNSEPRNSFSVIHTDAPPLLSHMALLKLSSRYTPRPVEEFIELARGMSWKNLHPASGAPADRIE